MVSCFVRAMKTSKEKKQSRGGERAEPGATLGWWEGLRGERPREGTCGLRLKQQQGARQAKAGKGELPSVNILLRVRSAGWKNRSAEGRRLCAWLSEREREEEVRAGRGTGSGMRHLSAKLILALVQGPPTLASSLMA